MTAWPVAKPRWQEERPEDDRRNRRGLVMTVRAVARAVVLVGRNEVRLTAATSLLRLAHLPNARALLTPRKENKHAATERP